MKDFQCVINNIQHIKQLSFELDLSKNQLTAIVGKNASGKTTLIRAIKTLISADTFATTASPYIFKSNSSILFTIDTNKYEFKYNTKLKTIDSKAIIDADYKNNIKVELPIPDGQRFNYEKLGTIDEALRTKISLGDYEQDEELVEFLKKIYPNADFQKLYTVNINKINYYFILREDNFYIREDYLSSGEHFIISLYKIIQQQCKLIVIDELDISLDASAQVKLVDSLRDFCTKYKINIVFTTHSLALMKTLENGELQYLDFNKGNPTLEDRSYNYIKSLLFGFRGWDRYILTEDIMLKKYLKYLIKCFPKRPGYKYKIIFIGVAHSTVGLMTRNQTEGFFGEPGSVLTVLDGDQKDNYQRNDIYFIPFKDIEKGVFQSWKDGEFSQCNIPKGITNPKTLYSHIKNCMTDNKIFEHLNQTKDDEVAVFSQQLSEFLNPRA